MQDYYYLLIFLHFVQNNSLPTVRTTFLEILERRLAQIFQAFAQQRRVMKSARLSPCLTDFAACTPNKTLLSSELI